MKPSLREILADSHVSAVAIAALLVWSLDSGFRALWDPLYRLADFLFTAVAILNTPYSSPYSSFSASDLLGFISAFSYLFSSVVSLSAAFLLSRWVYGVGPLRVLSSYRNKLRGGDNA